MPQQISSDVLLDTYAHAGERSADHVRLRVASVLAGAEPAAQRERWRQQFEHAQRAGFIAGGRIAAHAGLPGGGTMINCFVQPIGDSVAREAKDSASIYGALLQTAETLRLGGGVGLDFSPIRPAGCPYDDSDARSPGPLGVVRLFECSSQVWDDASSRRGAQMGVLRCDHPDIEAFVAAKRGAGLAHFNLSVAVTDEFMRAVATGADIDLVHIAEPSAEQRHDGAARRADGLWVYRRVAAAALWQSVVRAAYRQGEPGVLFVDRINDDNNLRYCETIRSTNPCGEQPLPPYGSCCLGSIDLTRLVREPLTPQARFAFDELAAIVPVAVRMLDNVIDLTNWPWHEQRAQARAKRRVGLGFTGLGDALIMLGLHYGQDAARAFAAQVARCLRDAAYRASVELARERGVFPAFDAERLLRDGTFASRLPGPLKDAIREHGLRNSHLLSIAPAGSVSLAFADNASSGIEPAYAWHYLRHRRRRDAAGVIAYDVEDPAWRLFRRLHGADAALPPAFVTALELSPDEHLEMVAAVAPYIDGAISKTVNAPEQCSYGDFESLYRRAWERGLKGVTAFRPNTVLGSVLHPCRPSHDLGSAPGGSVRQAPAR